MNRKLLVASFISFAMLATASLADPSTPKPEKCPCVCSIKEVGITMVEKMKDGKWVAGVMSNKYDTKENWTFGVGFFEAQDHSEAMTKAKEALKTLRLVSGPTNFGEKWACLYTNDEGMRAGAITPTYDEPSVLSKLVK